MPIRALDPKVVARIAAGEVVERPASVVKELVENSLDAGSSQISVEVRGGGVGLIRVTDNGAGIPSGEMALAFERYATSKLKSLADLESIQSLGFRGEALPSIAAVAEVDITSCAAGETGSFLELRDGTITSRGSRGRSRGTTVTVNNLFRRIPARLKFLKSAATENSHIANVVSQYALAFPEVKFSLLIDGRAALRTPGSGKLIDNVAGVYGAEVAENMIEIKDTAALSPKITGMVGSPKVSRSGRGNLSFFVNRRWVNSRMLARAVEEAYHGLLMVGRHPVAVINIALPPQDLDVNIHPTKSEVKFRNDSTIFSAVHRAVRQALTEQITVPRIKAAAAGPVFPSVIREPAAPYAGASPASITPAPTPALSLPVLRVLGQLNNSYIIAEGPDGLYLIDQHAAHERILFEKISRQRAQRDIEIQGLLEPMTLEVSPRQEAILKSRCQDLAGFGFAIEPFGDRTFLVRALPALIHDKDWAGMLRELLDSLSEGEKGGWVEAVTRTMACHGAVRAGQSLTDAEIRELIRQLEQCITPYTCPHGRPTMIHLGYGQLKKEFGRT